MLLLLLSSAVRPSLVSTTLLQQGQGSFNDKGYRVNDKAVAVVAAASACCCCLCESLLLCRVPLRCCYCCSPLLFDLHSSAQRSCSKDKAHSTIKATGSTIKLLLLLLLLLLAVVACVSLYCCAGCLSDAATAALLCCSTFTRQHNAPAARTRLIQR